jgi:abortive infection bacteriophage resistance protein
MRKSAGFFMPAKRTFIKPALTIDEQLNLLKSRGLFIPCEEEARNFLKTVSYYRLSAYTFYYEKKNADNSRSHSFYEGKTFTDVKELYIFDSKLRRLFWEAIERIEIAFRSSLSYHLSLQYTPHWYTDNDLFVSRFDHEAFIEKFKKDSSFFYNPHDNKRMAGEVFINHYYTNYDTPQLPPGWMACEIIPLGRLSRLYSSLKKFSDQKLIARDFGLDSKIFVSWMRSLSYMRNLCAHYCRIWNRNFNVNQPANPKHLGIVFNPQDRVYSYMVICAILLKQIDARTKWTDRIKSLLNDYPNIAKKSMGFLDGWEKESTWQ